MKNNYYPSVFSGQKNRYYCNDVYVFRTNVPRSPRQHNEEKKRISTGGGGEGDIIIPGITNENCHPMVCDKRFLTYHVIVTKTRRILSVIPPCQMEFYNHNILSSKCPTHAVKLTIQIIPDLCNWLNTALP